MKNSESPPADILLVEDDHRFAQRMIRNLKEEGFSVMHAERGDEAVELISRRSFHLLLTDIKMPGMNGIELLEAVKVKPGIDPDLPVVMLTSIESVDNAVHAMRLGAADYITKSAERDELIARLRKVLNEARIYRENTELRRKLDLQIDQTGLVAISPVMSSLLREICSLAETSVTVLIQGETGVGKEVVAREIHRLSRRPPDQWVAINCAALPEDDKFQSELFGHERGAFTGATERKRGHFERCEGGTLFLDEIGELSNESQSKLLRVLETGEFTRMGGTQTLTVNARILLATNKDLKSEVQSGRFRSDLFYRISVAPITIPPLHRRVEDIEPLVLMMNEQFARQYGKPPRLFTEPILDHLRAYQWPGNVRELRNVVEGLFLRGHTGEVRLEELRLEGPSLGQSRPVVNFPTEGYALEEIERSAVEQALALAGNNQSAAARLLHISPDRLAARIKKFGIRLPS